MTSPVDPLERLEMLIAAATPGPWFAIVGSKDEDGPIVRTRSPWRAPYLTQSGAVYAAFDYIAQTTYDMQSTTERPTAGADARLIALAPALGAAVSLARVLEPFAAMADVFDPPRRPSQGTADDSIIYSYSVDDRDYVLTVGMARAARAALASFMEAISQEKA